MRWGFKRNVCITETSSETLQTFEKRNTLVEVQKFIFFTNVCITETSSETLQTIENRNTLGEVQKFTIFTNICIIQTSLEEYKRIKMVSHKSYFTKNVI